MSQLYDNSELEHWKKISNSQLQFIEQSTKDLSVSAKPSPQHKLGMASLYYRDRGYVSYAMGDLIECKKNFQLSCEYKFKVFQLVHDGILPDKILSAGDFPLLLQSVAFCTAEESKSYSSLFKIEAMKYSLKDSLYLGTFIKGLIESDKDSINQLLKKKVPKVDKQFFGYVDCLKAIYDEDINQFRTSIQETALVWKKFAKRRLSGIPQVIFFADGIGLIKLASLYLSEVIKIEGYEVLPLELQ